MGSDEGDRAIAIEGLEFRYGEEGFSLNVPEIAVEGGSTVALVGPSGSGKTTLLSIVAGILVPLKGSIRVGGTAVSELSDAQRRDFRITRMGLVFQDFELVEYLNVRENILLPFFINRSLTLDDSVREAARGLARSVGIEDKLTRPVLKLSQGERQRVAICRALLPGPRVLLADEPTGDLDPANAKRIMRMLFERARASGATLVAATHDHGLLDEFDTVIDLSGASKDPEVEG